MNAVPSKRTQPAARPEHLPPASASTHFARRALWFNTVVLACVIGACCAIGLIIVTYGSIALTGANSGRYLNLLGVFFPGYTASPVGAWIGGFWAFLFAAISSGVVFQVYARAIAMNFDRSLYFDHHAKHLPHQLIIMISPRALGLAIGAILALQLALSTTWLVITGQAAYSSHAALLRNYLPFYKVNLMGAVIGGFEIFIYGFVFAYIFSVIYNYFVKKLVGAGHAG
jgi:hypothetical protein